MNFLTISVLGIFIVALVIIYLDYLNSKKTLTPVIDNSLTLAKQDLAQARLELNKAFQEIGQFQSKYSEISNALSSREFELRELKLAFDKLQHQKISADVRVGQKTENIMPFLEDFPYRDEEIRGLFNPIDLIVFAEDAVVFVEVKTGNAQLSEKQRKIRKLVNEGRVRFEVHRLNGKGIEVK